jgi:hypothetical protein
MSTQHNSEIVKEAFDLLHGRCLKSCAGKLVVGIYDKKSLNINLNYDKSNQEFINAKLDKDLLYQVCKECPKGLALKD